MEIEASTNPEDMDEKCPRAEQTATSIVDSIEGKM